MRFAVLIIAFLISIPACSEPADGLEKGRDSTATKAGEGAPAAYRLELLEVAFRSASAMPANPHIKGRSLAQQQVVDAALELRVAPRAGEMAAAIGNWRRGLAFANLAAMLAGNGDADRAERYLELAEQVIREIEAGEGSQAWRRDRIRVAAAEACLKLGQSERAARHSSGLVSSEAGKLDRVLVDKIGDDEFDARLQSLDAVFAKGDFDQVRSALEICVLLHERFHGNAERRAATEKRVRFSYEKLPLDVRYRMLLDLAENSAKHSASEDSERLVDIAEKVLTLRRWLPEHEVPLRARLAAACKTIGDADRARAVAKQALDLYSKHQERIVNIYRADALIPLAEAWVRIGDLDEARKVYALALEEAVVNPNSVPRAEDLVGICVSMAKFDCEPGDEIRTRIQAISSALGSPW